MLAGGAGRLDAADPPRPSLLWQFDLSKLECPSPSFDSGFNATRQAIFASEERVVVSYAGSPSSSDGKTLLTPVCTLAIKVSDGSILASRKQTVPIYQNPLLFPTAAGQVILVTGGAVLLNSDLTETGVSLDVPAGGRISHVSPDGKVVAIEGNSETRLFDTVTFRPTGLDLDGGAPSTITAKSSATNNTFPIDRKPGQQFAFVATKEASRSVLLPKCHTGFQVDYLNEDQMLITCGDSYQVQDQDSHVLADNRLFGKHVLFGGVSRDGKRFVVRVIRQGLFDPWPVNDEEFRVYEVGQKKASAAVVVQHPAEGSWSALSPKGDLLLIGSADGLRLYRLP
jgi:hypothetical protein